MSQPYALAETTQKENEKYAKLNGLTFPFCHDVGKYEIITLIGKGTFGEVYKARHRKNRNIVALKKILTEKEKEGFPMTALREIKILMAITNKNVVELIEVCGSKPTKLNGFRGSIYIVFEFCEHDLAGLLSNNSVTFSQGEIKMVLQQMFNGLHFLHHNEILHRDMKAANILVTREGTLKLADFGLSRAYTEPTENKKNRYTNRVVTLWFRPPELLLGETNYGPSIDLWGAGCIMAEMWTRSPIMQGSSEGHQLDLISRLCGSITPECWPGVVELKIYKSIELPKGLKRKVRERLEPCVKCCHALDLLEKLLTLDPSKRIDSNNALDHDYFWKDPMPCNLDEMLSKHHRSMFNYLPASSHKRGLQHEPGQQKPVPFTSIDEQYTTRIF